MTMPEGSAASTRRADSSLGSQFRLLETKFESKFQFLHWIIWALLNWQMGYNAYFVLFSIPASFCVYLTIIPTTTLKASGVSRKINIREVFETFPRHQISVTFLNVNQSYCNKCRLVS
jgi:hypothetical protein